MKSFFVRPGKCGLTYRSSRWIAFLLVGGVALAAAPARAEDRQLSLDEALQFAKDNNRDLEAAKARLDEAKQGVYIAMTALLPTIQFQGSYTYNYRNATFGDLFGAALNSNPTLAAFGLGKAFGSLDDIVVLKQNALQGTLSGVVPLIVPSAYAGLDASRQSFDASKANFKVSETNILFAAAQAYFAAAGTDELVQARQDAINVAEVTLHNAQARFAAGTVNKTEITRAQIALLSAQQAEKQAEDARDHAYRSLATIIVLRDPFHVHPPPQSSAPQPEPPVAALSQQAVELRPEFKAYDANINAANSQILADGFRWIPSLNGFGNASLFNYAGFTGDKYSWAVGLQLNWVIFDGGARDYQREQVEAQKIELEAQQSQLHDTINDDIANSARALITYRSALATAEQSTALSKETLDLIRAQYDAGTATQLDVLQAQDALVGSEVQTAQARFDLALADLALQRDAGTFPAGVNKP